MFLITGAGRSGSKYIAQVLSRCGLDVGHEQMGRDGIVSGFYAFEARRYPGKHPAPRPRFDVTLHQVREPLATIASLQTGKSWGWVCQFLPVGKRAPLLTRCAHYWLTWNLAAEKQAAFTYRIEALEAAWPELQARLSISMGYADATRGISRRTNTRPHGAVTWAQVQAAAPDIYPAIIFTAARYGYGVVNG